MIEITSRDNPKLKHIRDIRDGRETDFVFIEGLRLAREAMRSPIEIAFAVFAKGFENSFEFDEIQESIVVPDRIFDSLADTKNSQGIVLIAKRPSASKDNFTERFSGSTAVFLHRVNNPSNLGAILRTCEAAGTTDVVISCNSANAFSPKALRASMGAALRLNIWTDAEFEDAVGWSRSVGLTTTAADVSGKLAFREVDWRIPRLIVFGSEAHGLGPAELAAMDELIVIPMENDVESLNLAVSAGIILFEKTRSGN
ncbi:MAG: RNA methyltransferase [Acidobacteria bacterium]|nr:RNA methyltransferase [Acidobacteriota bacterium]